MKESKESWKELLNKLKAFFVERLDIRQEKENEQDTIEYIKKGVELKGTNLWVLIFAIFIASLGLNINSTAVIIGAMLISPLMGPIMGFGLGMGINDFELFKRSLRVFATAAIYSILASTLYFLITPYSEVQSELLARTSPSFYDVLIAFFGGCAGIIASCSKNKGNVIPGVAIATALMPPLCTAGFGLATANWNFFFGALYLFLINSVFIALATFFAVRILKFPIKTQVNATRQKQVSRIITAIVVCTIIPCVFITYNMIQNTVYRNQANIFINEELNFQGTYIVDKEIISSGKQKEIRVVMIGRPVSDELIEQAEQKLQERHLHNTKLVLQQGVAEAEDTDALDVIKDFYYNAQESLKEQRVVIDSLGQQLKKYQELDQLSIDLLPEFKAIFPRVKEVSISQTLIVNVESGVAEPTTLVYLTTWEPLTPEKRKMMTDWLKARTESTNLKLIEQ